LSDVRLRRKWHWTALLRQCFRSPEKTDGSPFSFGGTLRRTIERNLNSQKSCSLEVGSVNALTNVGHLIRPDRLTAYSMRTSLAFGLIRSCTKACRLYGILNRCAEDGRSVSWTCSSRIMVRRLSALSSHRSSSTVRRPIKANVERFETLFKMPSIDGNRDLSGASKTLFYPI
jgi:hypothetical protein